MYKEGQASTTFDFEEGSYDIVFVGIGENDGRSTFKLMINDMEVGIYSPPLADQSFEEGKNFNALWEKIRLKKGDQITVIAQVGSTDGQEWSRGRWAGIVFAPVGKGETVQEAPSSFSSK